MINNKYKIIKKLSHGSFGNVYLVNNNNNIYALKEELNNVNNIKYEAFIYTKINHINNVCKFYDYFNIDNKSYLLLHYYDNNLVNIKSLNTDYILNLHNNNNLFNEKVINYYKYVKHIIVILINTLESIHELGFVHRDIKPSNICIYNDEPILIDFGLTKKIINNEKHINEKKINSIIGSPNYVSINVINNIEPTRRDDI